MDISMIGIDYSKATVENRELFSLTVSQGVAMSNNIISKYDAKGCVVLSTCNRTELWFSGLHSSPLSVFLKEKGMEEERYKDFFVERSGEEAVNYLYELTCGMHSQIFGEDQILTQVKSALKNARDNNHIDSILETLFRLAITAAKKVKTEVRLTTKNTSVPESVISLLYKKFGSLKGKRCLVIGNGEIGRLMAKQLVNCSCIVTMTLRQYKGKDVIIPEGCDIIKYDKRYDVIGDMDYIFSATSSPHYTIKLEQIRGKLTNKQYHFIDLAIPRDVDPEIREVNNVTIYDMDSIGMDVHCNEEELEKAKTILKKHQQEFLDWYFDKNYIHVIHKIGAVTGEIVDAKLTKEYKKMDISLNEQLELRKNIQSATQRSVEKLIFAAKEHMDTMQWVLCIDAFNQAIEEFE